MANSLLHFYRNGNTSVALFENGTKIRIWPDGAASQPAFPESIDLKITGYCDMDGYCTWCHESSTREGQHGSTDQILELFRQSRLPSGVELAIGGGNPLAFPELPRLLQELIHMGYVPNLTVNALHLKQFNRMFDTPERLALVRGLGVSYNPALEDELREVIARHPHVIVHMIAGVHTPEQFLRVATYAPRILVLGYKIFGRGAKYYSDAVEASLESWHQLFVQGFPSTVICFDNLALEQLHLQEILSPEQWERLYMGDDGTHSMYIDASTWSFAPTSRQARKTIPDASTVTTLFDHVRTWRTAPVYV